jgi:hypothetical protein
MIEEVLNTIESARAGKVRHSYHSCGDLSALDQFAHIGIRFQFSGRSEGWRHRSY